MLVRFNLATKPLETHRVFLALCGAAGALAVLAFLVLGWHVYKVRKADTIYRIGSITKSFTAGLNSGDDDEGSEG